MMTHRCSGFVCGFVVLLMTQLVLPGWTGLPGVAAQVPPLISMSRVLVALEEDLERIYDRVKPSVVNIRVIQEEEVTPQAFPEFPGQPFGTPGAQESNKSFRQGSGSGFVWDTEGHIVTNNHVVADADRISVTLHDGTTVPADVIGTDPDADLAVLKIDLPAVRLFPVRLTDSTQVKVGQLGVAIGNPFGLQSTMTVGFISALGRLLPVESSNDEDTGYSIPDIIQTDASINPGNSGGVLVNSQGYVIGVTSAIISPVGASVGIGFAIPSAIVQKVVPMLIQTGHYEHAWLGLSGYPLTPELAKKMHLGAEQRGALVVDVVPDSPADKAGVHGSDRQVQIDGEQTRVGGDVIVAIDQQVVQSFDDMVTYLARSVEVGQTITLHVLRYGQATQVQVKLEARPNPGAQQPQSEMATSDRVWLGIQGLTVTPELARAMKLPENQQGILIEQVIYDSPADHAGLRGSFKPWLIQAMPVLIGGDILLAIDQHPLTQMVDLLDAIQQAQPGQHVFLTLLRDGKPLRLAATLTAPPTTTP